MRLGDIYFHHPRIALSMHTLTACALGYVTHIIQQQWHRENFLPLHISIWWLIVVLLHFAERPFGSAVSPEPLSRSELSKHFRLNALFEGAEAWFGDAISEDLTEDMPTGGPLFRSVCLRMPDCWQLNCFETSIWKHTQSALFGRAELPCIEVDFGDWETGWRLTVISVKNATHDKVRIFLQDLHCTLETTDGVIRVRWYHDAMLQGGQMMQSDYRQGTATPIESPTNL